MSLLSFPASTVEAQETLVDDTCEWTCVMCNPPLDSVNTAILAWVGELIAVYKASGCEVGWLLDLYDTP